MDGQRRFDVIAGEMARESSAARFLLLDSDLRIRAASSAYEDVTLREHGELLGEFLFDAFPDDPEDPQASGTAHLAASLDTAMRSGHTDDMRILRYDIPDPAAPGKFQPKVWSPVNSPLVDHGELVGVVHRCGEEISDLARAVTIIARAIEAGGSWPAAEVLHTLAAVCAVETARHAERHQALIAQSEQLRCAIETRDTIGQAKGIVMERFGIDALAALGLLVKLAQQANLPVEQIAHKLIELDHPPGSS